LKSCQSLSCSSFSQHFMETEDLLPFSQEPWARSIQSIPPPSLLSKIHFNIILPLALRSSHWSPSFWFPHRNPLFVPLLPLRDRWQVHLIALHCITLITFGEEYKYQWMWPHGLRHEPSSLVRTLGSWVRNLLKAWMHVRLFCVCVLCVGSALATNSSPVQGVLPTMYRIKKRKKRPRYTGP
jgi:hypothetical protein